MLELISFLQCINYVLNNNDNNNNYNNTVINAAYFTKFRNSVRKIKNLIF